MSAPAEQLPLVAEEPLPPPPPRFEVPIVTLGDLVAALTRIEAKVDQLRQALEQREPA